MNPKDKAEKAYEDTVAMTKLNKEIDMLGVGLKLEKINRELFPDKPTDEIERRAEEYSQKEYDLIHWQEMNEEIVTVGYRGCLKRGFLFGHSAAKEEVERLKGIISKHAQDLRDNGTEKLMAHMEVVENESVYLVRRITALEAENAELKYKVSYLENAHGALGVDNEHLVKQIQSLKTAQKDLVEAFEGLLNEISEPSFSDPRIKYEERQISVGAVNDARSLLARHRKVGE